MRLRWLADGPIELNAGYGEDDFDALPRQLTGEGISSCLTTHRELPRKFGPCILW